MLSVLPRGVPGIALLRYLLLFLLRSLRLCGYSLLFILNSRLLPIIIKNSIPFVFLKEKAMHSFHCYIALPVITLRLCSDLLNTQWTDS